MLIQLERYTRPQLSIVGEGEDDGIDVPVQGAPIAINPAHVAAMFASTQDPDAIIIRLADGRGFAVRGTYERLASVLGVVLPEMTQ